jgi:superfamily II DNA or RNA helicase
MIKLTVNNRYVTIEGANSKAMRQLSDLTSYSVAGHVYAPSFQNKRWDGKIHLMKFSRKKGYFFPIGLLIDVYTWLTENDHKAKVIDKRVIPTAKIQFEWNPEIKMRPYQNEAVEAVTGKALPGRGILVMPIRSGKTYTAARIIHQLGVKTLIIVTSQLLLYQTRDAIQKVLLRGDDIGVIGDGKWQESAITVATVHTLQKARGTRDKKGNILVPPNPKYKAMLAAYDMVIFDEVHHTKAPEWRGVMEDFPAPYKLGLSATVYFDEESEMDTGVIWLKAVCGSVRYTITPSTLIEAGYLVKPSVTMYRIKKPESIATYRWCKELQEKAIYKNPYRNNKIVKLACKYARKGMRVIIISNRLNQVEDICQRLDKTDFSYAPIVGSIKAARRRELIEEFSSGSIPILVGTVIGEGIDIPEIECVINAEGGKDLKATVQRMRNLTPNKGKKKAIFIDFIDYTNDYFHQHSMARLKQYRTEDAFDVSIV